MDYVLIWLPGSLVHYVLVFDVGSLYHIVFITKIGSFNPNDLVSYFGSLLKIVSIWNGGLVMYISPLLLSVKPISNFMNPYNCWQSRPRP